MHLIYLALAGFFGVETILLLLLTFGLPDVSVGMVILLLFSTLLLIFFVKKYLDAIAANQKVSENSTQAMLKDFGDHKAAFEAWLTQLETILTNKYHFKKIYCPKFLTHPEYSGDIPMYALFKENISPQAAAELILDELKFQGDELNPEIFHETFTRGKLSPFSGLYKLLLGSHAPSSRRVLGSFGFLAILALTFYGCPQMIKGPYSDIFLPSTSWYTFGYSATWLLVGVGAICTYRGKSFRERLKRTHSKADSKIILVFMPVVLFFVCYVFLIYGIGKFLNEITGESGVITIPVVKDLDISKSSGRHTSTAYCVKIFHSGAHFMQREYCLKKDDYDKLDATAPVFITFIATSSPFGYRINGYYDNFKSINDIQKSLLLKNLKNNSTSSSAKSAQ